MSNNRRRETGTRTAEQPEETTAATWRDHLKTAKARAEAAQNAMHPWRTGLAPHVVMHGLFGAAAALQLAPDAPLYTTSLGVLAVGSTFVPVVKKQLVKVGMKTKAQTAWTRTAVATGTGWLAAATFVGIGSPMPQILIGATVALGLPWWRHHRFRLGPPTIEEPIAVEDVPLALDVPEDHVWDTKIACPTGPLAGATVEGWEAIEYGRTTGVWRADDAKILVDMAIEKTKQLTQLYRRRLGDILLERHADGIEGHLQLTVLDTPPVHNVTIWAGPSLNLETGIFRLGPYADGRGIARMRLYKRGYGIYHTLVSGGTGSGKSVVLSEIISEVEHSGVGVTWVIDPQGGQSLPDWVNSNRLNRVATDTDEAHVMIYAAEKLMMANSAYLANVEWEDTDEEGNTYLRKGLPWFDPTPEMPFLCLVIDEAHMLLSDPKIAKVVGNIAKMGRKCGVMLVLATQTPTQEELGGQHGGKIRDNILMGNCIVLRTKSRMAAPMLVLPISPTDLPETFPAKEPGGEPEITSGIGFAIGPASDRRVMMRADWDRYPHRWINTSPNTKLHEISEKAAAYIFDNPHLVLGEDSVSAVVTPLFAVPSTSAPAAEVDAEKEKEAKRTAREKIVAHLRSNGPTTRADLLIAVRCSPTQLHRVCGDLSDEGVLLSENGVWTYLGAETEKAS